MDAKRKLWYLPDLFPPGFFQSSLFLSMGHRPAVWNKKSKENSPKDLVQRCDFFCALLTMYLSGGRLKCLIIVLSCCLGKSTWLNNQSYILARAPICLCHLFFSSKCRSCWASWADSCIFCSFVNLCASTSFFSWAASWRCSCHLWTSLNIHSYIHHNLHILKLALFLQSWAAFWKFTKMYKWTLSS